MVIKTIAFFNSTFITQSNMHCSRAISYVAQIWEPLLPPFLFGTVRVQDFLTIGGWRKFGFVRVLNF